MDFISYSRKDSEHVTLFENIFKSKKLKYFKDIQDIHPGEKWLPALENAIEKSEKFYLFWSLNAQQSKNVQKEIDFVTKKEKPVIIPMMLDSTPLPNLIMEYHGFDFMKKLYDDLRKTKKSEKFYKKSTITLLILFIVCMSYILPYSLTDSLTANSYNTDYTEENTSSYPREYNEVFYSDGVDSSHFQEVETPASSPTIEKMEPVSREIPKPIFEYIGIFLLLVTIYFFISYVHQRKIFNNKVEEFVKHI